MPYTSIDQLPPPIRNNLPPRAQTIFMKAFNHAYAELAAGQDEVPAFKIGWAAVKKSYEKKNGKWQPKRTRTAGQKKAS